MDPLISQLQKVGLPSYESSVYAVLLAQSPASASFIAKKCHLARSTVYTALSGLVAKGLVGTTYKNEVKQFIAEDITSIENLLKNERNKLDQRFQTLSTLKKSLPSLKKSQALVPQIIFFEGQEGLKKIYLDMMLEAPKNATLYLIRDEFVWENNWQFIFETDWHDRIARIKKEKNIQTKLLVNGSAIEQNHRQFYELKQGLSWHFFPSAGELTHFAIYILADVVCILSIENNNLIGIKIVNENIAENFKNVFTALW